MIQNNKNLIIMQKDEAKDLEEEFGNLFSNNSHSDINEQARNQPQQPPSFNLITFQQMPYTETESDSDFLDQVDQVLDHAVEGEGEPSRREVMLNFKINELKTVCKNLKTINTKLRDRIRQLQESRPSEVHIQSSISMQANKGDLTAIQQDFVELQASLKSYKDQLAMYQQKMAEQLSFKDKQIQQFRYEAQEAHKLRKNLQQLSRDLQDKDHIIAMLQRRNEQLLLELQQRQEQCFDEDHGRRDSFNDRISSELETMIDKLLRQLKFQKKTSSKQTAEIKRLNSEIIQLQSTIKQKNNKIYELQMNLIKISKINQQKKANQSSSKEYYQERSPAKKEYSDSSSSFQKEYVHQYQMNPYPPAQRKPEKDFNSKNRSHQTNRSYDKNRMSAERENGARNVYLPSQSRNQPGRVSHSSNPLSRPLSFTLMDLLNKEFKIREVQKEIIACRIVDLYSKKIMQQSYENLIPEEIEIYNFSPQNLSNLKVRINLMSKGEQESVTQEKVLYNMAFILDNLLGQVDVVDAYVEHPLELNISEYISQLQTKASREEKFKFLQELASNIESYALNQ